MTGPGIEPDKLFPPKSVTAAPGFSAYSQTTKDQYNQQIRGQLLGSFQGLVGLCQLLNSLPIFTSLQQLGQGGGISTGTGNTGNLLAGVQKLADTFAAVPAGTATVGSLVPIINELLALPATVLTTAQAIPLLNQLIAALGLTNLTSSNPQFNLESTINQLTGLVASLAGRVTALENQPTPSAGATTVQTANFANTTLAQWTTVSGSFAIANSIIQTAALSAGYIGTSGTPRTPATDRHGITLTVDAKQIGVCRGFICADTALTNYAAVEIYSGWTGDSVRICTGSSPSLVVEQAHVDMTSSVPNKTAFDIRYDNNGNFNVLRNGTQILTWADSSNIVTHGSTKRNTGLVSNGWSSSTYPGFGLSSFTYYDW